jgi:hypothetical protein
MRENCFPCQGFNILLAENRVFLNDILIDRVKQPGAILPAVVVAIGTAYKAERGILLEFLDEIQEVIMVSLDLLGRMGDHPFPSTGEGLDEIALDGGGFDRGPLLQLDKVNVAGCGVAACCRFRQQIHLLLKLATARNVANIYNN